MNGYGVLQAASVVVMALLVILVIKICMRLRLDSVPAESWTIRTEVVGNMGTHTHLHGRGWSNYISLSPGRYFVGNRRTDDILVDTGPKPFEAILILQSNGTVSFTLLKGKIRYMDKVFLPDDKSEITFNRHNELIINSCVGLMFSFERGSV